MHDDHNIDHWTIEFLPANPPPSKVYKGFWRDIIGLIVVFVVSAILFSL